MTFPERRLLPTVGCNCYKSYKMVRSVDYFVETQLITEMGFANKGIWPKLIVNDQEDFPKNLLAVIFQCYNIFFSTPC